MIRLLTPLGGTLLAALGTAAIAWAIASTRQLRATRKEIGQ